MGRRLILIVILSLVLPGALCAESHFYGGIQLGYAVLTGDAGREMDDAFSPGIFLGHDLAKNTSIEASLMYSSHDDEVPDIGDYSMDVISLLFGPRFTYPLDTLAMYFGTGPGVYRVHYKYKPEFIPGIPRDETDVEFGVYLDLGFVFRLKEGRRLGFDMRYHHVIENELLDGDMMTIGVRVVFDKIWP